MMNENKIFKIVGNLEIDKLKELIYKKNNLNIYSKYPPHFTLLQFAIAEEEHTSKSLSIIELIIDGGADINGWDKKKQTNPILLASKYGNEKVVKILLDREANFNVVDADGEFPLRFFAKKGNCDMTKILLEKGADEMINKAGGISGMNPLGLAVNNCDIEMILLLLEHGAKPLIVDNVYMNSFQRFPKDVSSNIKNQIIEILENHSR